MSRLLSPRGNGRYTSIPNEHEDVADTPRDQADVVVSDAPTPGVSTSLLRRRNSSESDMPKSPTSPKKSNAPAPPRASVAEENTQDEDSNATSAPKESTPVLHPLEDPSGNLHIRILDLNGKVFLIQCSSDWSVDRLKGVVQAKSGVDEARQRLIYRGRVLEDTSLLSEYKVEDEHTIHLFVRQVPTVPEVEDTSTSASSNRMRDFDDPHRVLNFHGVPPPTDTIRNAVFPSESARRLDPIMLDTPLGMAARRVKLWASFILIINTMKLLGQFAFLANYAAQRAAGMNEHMKKEMEYTPLYDESSYATIGKLSAYAWGVYVGCVGFKAAHDTDLRPVRQYCVGLIILGVLTMIEQVYEIMRFSSWDPDEYRKARAYMFSSQQPQPTLDEMVRSYIVQTFVLAMVFVWAVKHGLNHRDELASYNETLAAAAMNAVPLPPMETFERANIHPDAAATTATIVVTVSTSAAVVTEPREDDEDDQPQPQAAVQSVV
ncbi:unnamed protein product [Aphanomyces euteiches]|uniref:Ubiquitin-like domain-containing protein n=1 Tax=Aphanomyces euteiches TaxID=100861 RepID=A0A6G0XR97_9STRA|nr:hypothetical protein Ae201684_002131 [Aphanomyces euteiches]KAH9086646.1 hypothetical protein Ae201684P_000068 [Aphanomyces euteiches]KAH9132432.1 hypothetical protein AeRB84_021190 [Aphanomyces euteiches]